MAQATVDNNITGCRVIQFAGFLAAKEAAKPVKEEGAPCRYKEARTEKHAANMLELETSPEKFSTTGLNARLRHDRWEKWRVARRLERYWRARLDWNSALVIAQEDDVADANTFAKCDREQSNVICGLWRVALVGQMLSPVPDAAAVEWKRAQLKAGQHRFVATVTEEQIQRSIDQDVQWLQAHPTRRHAKKGATND